MATTWMDLCKRFGLKRDTDWSWPGNGNSITFSNGSTVLLVDLSYRPSDPDYDYMGGLEITGAYIDEASSITQRARDVVSSRIRYRLNEFSLTGKILMTCNPTKGFLYSEFYQPFTANELPSTRAFIPALPTDNPFLPEQYLSALRSMDRISRLRLYEGHWEYDDDPAALVPYEKILQLFENAHIEVPGGTQDRNGKLLDQKYISVDPAYTGGDSTVILVWHGLKVIEVIEYSGESTSLERTNSTLRDACSRHNVPYPNVIIDVGGGYGNSAWENLKGSVRFNGGSSPVSKGNYHNLRTHCFYELAERIRNNEIYFPTDNTSVSIRVTRELEQLKRANIDTDGKLKVVPKYEMKQGLNGKSPDFLDALSMRMYFLLTSKPKPSFRSIVG